MALSFWIRNICVNFVGNSPATRLPSVYIETNKFKWRVRDGGRVKDIQLAPACDSSDVYRVQVHDRSMMNTALGFSLGN